MLRLFNLVSAYLPKVFVNATVNHLSSVKIGYMRFNYNQRLAIGRLAAI